MYLVTFSGPPSSGKTSVLTKLLAQYKKDCKKVGVVKFDCLHTNDDERFREEGIPVIKGLSGELCPDHYFVSNIEAVFSRAQSFGLEWLFSESAGLCNRCAPHIRDVLAVCVLDQMAGIHTPQKIGPMLQLADIVVITKADMVSQAEREVYAMHVQSINPKAQIFYVNGLTGEGILELYACILERAKFVESLETYRLRFPMPMATCSYCLGEKRIGKSYQQGNVKRLKEDFSYDRPKAEELVGLSDLSSLDSSEELTGKILEDMSPVKEAFQSIEVFSGQDKDGKKEPYTTLKIKRGEVIALVGPTGSGKSRFLEDLAMGADGRGLTRRRFLFDGYLMKDLLKGESISGKQWISHLSQNMHFVIDLSVEAFLLMHLHSRYHKANLDEESLRKKGQEVLKTANALAGEKIMANASLASLSGGQSRALMIADCALISPAPILLIDEIENAGIHKQEAVRFLSGKDKIVLLSTHDPVLALMADYRFVIGNGAIQKVLKRSQKEKKILEELLWVDSAMNRVREALREGTEIPNI